MHVLANELIRPTDWNAINWRTANRNVRNLRQRIFRASQAGDHRTVRSLQKLMLRSYSNTLTSVRRVTQTNAGRRTPGVDKVTIKTPEARGRLVDDLRTFQPWTAHPTRRLYIPKANGKQRPLGIPTIRDRCMQAIVKNALEPAWEATFEGSSYGFRPGRSTHDALAKIYQLARPNKKKKWVVDADIKGAFDNINHAYLLTTIGTFPARALIRQWLKAGYVEGTQFYDTVTGTPQGGVISPLLANIALHGMEQALGVHYDTEGYIDSPCAVVRYADDFVVFCESQADAEAAIHTLKPWLSERGLELSPEKTRIVHLREGFDFLGLNVRHYRAPLTTKTGYKLLIKPSRAAVQRLRTKLRALWLKHIGMKVDSVLANLNPVIRGWANYNRPFVASERFRALDEWMLKRQRRWAARAHPTKPTRWKNAKYWGRLNLERKDHWVFGNKQTGAYMLKFKWFKIERHVLVRGMASPDDPTLRAYWKQRTAAKAKDLIPSYQKIAQRQGHICPICGETLYNDEELHRDHIIPRSEGGQERYDNYRLLHLYCHQQRHRHDKTAEHEQDSRMGLVCLSRVH